MSKIVVTGYGIINALGDNAASVYERIFAGESGISTAVFQSAGESKEGSVGRILDFDSEGRDRCTALAIHAARECLVHAGFDPSGEDAYRRGVAIGTSLGGMLSGQEFHRQWLLDGLENADPQLLREYPLSVVADRIADEFGFQGVRNVISTACAASANIIGYGIDMINSGRYDYMLVGGADPLTTFSFSGFSSLKALDSEPCKPYSSSEGINLGEGAAFLLLESEEHALARNARIQTYIRGYGITADAYHPTTPDPGGSGAIRAMQMALEQGDIALNEVSYINGHGTGTKANDKAERIVLKNLMKDHLPNVSMSSIKGAIGHNLGAAGAQECVISIMALQNHLMPPTIRMKEGTGEAIDFVPNKAVEKDMDIILSNSFAFGGNNCCLALGKDGNYEMKKRIPDRIVITGKGCCGAGGSNIPELYDTFKNRTPHFERISLEIADNLLRGRMPEIDYKKHINPRVLRRLDTVSKLMMVSGNEALKDSSLKVDSKSCTRIGVVFSTASGPLETIVNIDEKIAKEGISAVSMFDFPNSVINAAAGNFCIENKLKGATSTICCGNASYLIALDYACELLSTDKADAIILIGADECNEALLTGYKKLDLLCEDTFLPLSGKGTGTALSQGSVALVLERRSDAEKRGANLLAEISSRAIFSDTHRSADANPRGDSLIKCVEDSVNAADIDNVDLYVCAAFGTKNCDEADINTISRMYEKELFGNDTCCSMISPYVGYAAGTACGYELLSAFYSFENQEIIGASHGDGCLDDAIADKFPKENQRKNVQTAVVSCTALGGICASAVLKNCREA